jgi:hypothetical protein
VTFDFAQGREPVERPFHDPRTNSGGLEKISPCPFLDFYGKTLSEKNNQKANHPTIRRKIEKAASSYQGHKDL